MVLHNLSVVPMFLCNPPTLPIKQTTTPWQAHFHRAMCYCQARRLPGDNRTAGRPGSCLNYFSPLVVPAESEKIREATELTKHSSAETQGFCG